MANIDPWAEKHVAVQAEKMLSSAMRNKISSLGFKEHLSKDRTSLSQTEAEAKTNLGKTTEGSGLRLYMNSLVLKMGKHGFVQHYGVNGTRENIKGRTRTKPHNTHYNFRNHIYRLPAKDFIDKAIKDSRVVPYVMHRITEIRCEDVFVRLKNFIEKD